MNLASFCIFQFKILELHKESRLPAIESAGIFLQHFKISLNQLSSNASQRLQRQLSSVDPRCLVSVYLYLILLRMTI